MGYIPCQLWRYIGMGEAWSILFGSSVIVAIYSHAGTVAFDTGERRTMAPYCLPETDRGKRVFFHIGVLFALHFHEWKHGSDAGLIGLGKKIVYLKYSWKVTRHPRLAAGLCTIQGQITVSIAAKLPCHCICRFCYHCWIKSISKNKKTKKGRQMWLGVIGPSIYSIYWGH